MASRAFLTLLIASGLSGSLPAADIEKANNTTALNLAGSYTAGGPPGAGDRILVNSVMATSRNAALGGDLSIAGIYFDTSASKDLTISGSNTLTLGASGIDIDATVGGLIFNGPSIVLGADQTWDLGTRGLQINGSTAINTNGRALTITGGVSQVYFRNSPATTLDALITGSLTLTLDATNTSLTLTNANSTFNGGLAISATNTVTASSLRVGTGTTSAVGTGAIQLKGGTFRYSGSTASTSQNFSYDNRNVSTLEVTTAGQTLTVATLNNGSSTTGTFQGNGLILGGVGNLVINDNIDNSTVVASGAATLTKFESGTVTLTKVNNYTGATTISGGTLILAESGTINNTSGVSVAAGATFTNNTAVAYNKALALAEGATINGSGAFNPTSMTITGDLAGGFTSFDFGGASLLKAGSLQLTLTGLTDGVYTLFMNGTITGAFASMSINGTALSSIGEGFSGLIDGYSYTFTNSLNQLTVAAVPEPSAFTLIVIAGAGIVFTLRRRRRPTC